MIDLVFVFSLILSFISGAALVFIVLYFKLKKSDMDLRKSQDDATKFKYENEILKINLENRQSLAQELKGELEESFKITSSEALEEKSKKLLELAHMSFKNESETHNEKLQKRDESFNKEFKFLFDQIQNYQVQLSNFENQRQKTLGLVEGQLKNIADTNTYLSQQTQSLKEALTRPNIRGRWGEIQLKNCVEMLGMSDFCDVDFQQEFKEGQKVLRPDMIVKLPSGKRIIVDAKTPMDFYLKYIDESNESLKAGHLEAHAKRLKVHIRELGSKNYSESVGVESLDYVIMFLPNESFLFAAIEADKDIIEYAMSNKVLISTPPTFVALLRAIQMGWGEYKVTENAKQIYKHSKELQKRLDTFASGFLSIENQLEKSLETFRKAKNSFKSRVLTQARRIESLEGVGLDDKGLLLSSSDQEGIMAEDQNPPN